MGKIIPVKPEQKAGRDNVEALYWKLEAAEILYNTLLQDPETPKEMLDMAERRVLRLLNEGYSLLEEEVCLR